MKIRPLRKRQAPDDALPDGFENLDPILARLYAARGITQPSELDYRLNQLAPISALDGVADAVTLLLRHRSKRIIVIGDFDADGATSTAPANAAYSLRDT